MVAPSRTKKSNDFTGRQAEQLAAEARANTKAREAEIAMITAQEQQEFEDTIQDVSVQANNPTIVDEVLDMNIELADHTVVVRVAEDIDNMTYGHGNNYTFKAGGKYKVPKDVAERLQSLGLLYERL